MSDIISGIITSDEIRVDRTQDKIPVIVVIAVESGELEKHIVGFFNTRKEAETYIGIEQTQFECEGWTFRIKEIQIDVGE